MYHKNPIIAHKENFPFRQKVTWAEVLGSEVGAGGYNLIIFMQIYKNVISLWKLKNKR
jgi:hypothetical protein